MSIGAEPAVPDQGGPIVEVTERDDRRRRLRQVVVAGVALLVLVLVYDAARGGSNRPPGAWTLTPHTGLGAWVDAYDWTAQLGGADPAVQLDDIDAMADAGVQTVYLQTSHLRSSDLVLEQERLEGLIDRIHDRGMHVVAWYLPSLVDVDHDLERLVASAELDVDGLGVDLESTEVTDPIERNRRLVDLSTRLRAAVGDKALAAITLSAVHLQVVNTAYWPGYPWQEIAATYDVVMPMAYWSIRTGELREGARYVGENLDRLRNDLGPGVPIHVIGGIADEATNADLDGMVTAMEREDVIGGSLYDWATSTPEQWQQLRGLREGRVLTPR
jgi:hypothetical protein